MKSLLIAAVFLTTILLPASSSAALGTAQLYIFDGTTTIVITDGGTGDLDMANPGSILFTGPIGVWNLNVVAGTTKPAVGGPATPFMDISSGNESLAPGTLTIRMTDTGFLPAGNVSLDIAGNTVGNVTFGAWADGGNSPFAKTTPLASTVPLAGNFASSASGTVNVQSPYSLTSEVVINHPGAGRSGFNAQLIVNPCTGQIGDFVWQDSDGNGCQDGELGIPGVQVDLYSGCAPSITNFLRTVNTDANGRYLFTGLCKGKYTVVFTTPNGYTRTVANNACSPNPVQSAALDSDCSYNCAPGMDCGICVELLTDNAQNLTIDCGYNRPDPCVQVIKTASKSQAKPFEPVEFTYVVTNCGGTTLTGLVVVDDHGTSNILGDDVVIGTIQSLAPHTAQTITKMLIPPVIICSTNTMVPSGVILINILGNGNVRATFVQDFSVNDNTYGANAYGWGGPNQHKFSNLTGSDKVVWEFKNGSGTVVMRFGQDYISQTNVSVTPYPSGYASLGFGGDGDAPNPGNPAHLVYSSSSLAENLNKPPFLNNLAQYIVNSPASNDVNAAQWEYRMMYTVELTNSAFPGGFGSASIIDQHNSPGKRSIDNPNPCDSCSTNVAMVMALAGNVTIHDTDDARVCISTNPPPPQMELFKSADQTVISPSGGSVTYSYTVKNNGAVPITGITVKDDNGTPADTSDDFTVGTIPSLLPGASTTLTVTKNLVPPTQPISLCATIDGQDIMVGTLLVEDLGSSIKVTYVQENLNDNRYGTGAANPATGWSSGHSFGNLTGSDKAQFRFVNGDNQPVLEFLVDYISATNPSPSFPSGFASLGVNGGEGDMITGSATNVLFATTSLSDNLRLPQFNPPPAGNVFTVNSPTETPLNSGVSTPAGWNYKNSYTVIVRKSAFGPSGYKDVSIVEVHNSPAKIGRNAATPEPCTACIVNKAVATGSAGLTTLTDTATAMVCFGTPAGSQGCNIETIEFKIDKKKIQLKLKNNGSADILMSDLSISWPQVVNGNLLKVKLNGDVWTGSVANSQMFAVADFHADPNRRTITPGQTKTLELEFVNNASTSGYSGTVKFGAGASCTITFP